MVFFVYLTDLFSVFALADFRVVECFLFPCVFLAVIHAFCTLLNTLFNIEPIKRNSRDLNCGVHP